MHHASIQHLSCVTCHASPHHHCCCHGVHSSHHACDRDTRAARSSRMWEGTMRRAADDRTGRSAAAPACVSTPAGSASSARSSRKRQPHSSTSRRHSSSGGGHMQPQHARCPAARRAPHHHSAPSMGLPIMLIPKAACACMAAIIGFMPCTHTGSTEQYHRQLSPPPTFRAARRCSLQKSRQALRGFSLGASHPFTSPSGAAPANATPSPTITKDPIHSPS